MTNQGFQRKNQRGSAIIWILVMIALFAALSFTLSQGSRSNAGFLTKERARLAASEIISYGDNLRNGVKAMLINGTALHTISFDSPYIITLDGNPSSAPNDYCTNSSCAIFAPGAGNMKELEFMRYSTTPSWWEGSWLHPGYPSFELSIVNGLGSDSSELVMKIDRIEINVCRYINEMAGLGYELFQEDQAGRQSYLFAWDTLNSLSQTNNRRYGFSEPKLAQKNFFCIGNASSPNDGGDIIYVLHAR